MSRADGLSAEARMAEDQHATPSKDAQKAMAYLPSFVRRVSAHQFLLAELPPDLRDALADYDVDGDGTVTVGEIAAGAHLLRRQKKKNAMMFKAVVGLFTLLVLQLGAITGLVFTVVKAMQQTSVSADSPVMTIKGSTTPVQVANSEFYVDPATGLFRTRTPSGSASGSARHLLQDVDPAARIASADFNLHSSGLMLSSNVLSQPSLFASMASAVDLFDDINGSSPGVRHLLQTTTSPAPAPLTVLPPVCDWASKDLFDLSSCDTLTSTGTVSITNTASVTKPYILKCDTMRGACMNFPFATKVSVPMWAQGYGNGGYDLGGRMASLSVGIVSMSRFPSAKTVSGTPCSMDLYRMYTNTELTSWIDLCLTPFANLYDGDKYCSNCPVGPFLDYTNLKYDANAFDPPCKPGFKVPTVSYWQGRVVKTIQATACYLSLNYVYDPIYAFDKQFAPGVTNDCPSPIQCPATSSTGRHLLAGGSSGSSGTGASPSDMRLKQNIVPTGRLIAGLLAEYTWQWNDAAKALRLDSYPTVGVMAQEAQALFPEAVSAAADGYLRIDYGMLV